PPSRRLARPVRRPLRHALRQAESRSRRSHRRGPRRQGCGSGCARRRGAFDAASAHEPPPRRVQHAAPGVASRRSRRRGGGGGMDPRIALEADAPEARRQGVSKMAALERWLCDPSRDELLRTLQEVLDGADYVGALHPSLRKEAPDWSAFVARAAALPEGKESWQPERGIQFDRDITLRPEVHVFWWTDGAGRR